MAALTGLFSSQFCSVKNRNIENKTRIKVMTPESVMNIGRLAMETTLMVGAPLLLVSLVVGLIISVFQAATQINEATLSFIPKLLGILLTLMIAGPWMISVLVTYMRGMFSNFSLLMG
jgi:flagellar biosynthetic protein FliQ